MGALRGERGGDGVGWVETAGLAMAGIGLLAVWAVQLFAVPQFAGMFADLGGTLPRLTLAVIAPTIASVATLATASIAAAGVALRLIRPGPSGTVLVIVAAAVPLATVPLMVYALYRPIFDLAAAVSA